jgi:hypothetical protein
MAHARALTQSPVESGVVLSLDILMLTRNNANARALTPSAVESGVVLRLDSLLLNTKPCECKSTYPVCCRERRSVEAIKSAAKHEPLRMQAHLNGLL